MKAVKDWENVQAATDYIPLAPGGYVCRIQGAKIKVYQGKGGSFERLEVALDIEEGEFAGHYRQDFESQNTEDKRWKGVLRMYVPTGDGSDADAYSARRLKAFVQAVEDSNPGYHWDWEESKLKGKLVGVLFRNEEWEFNGRTGWKAQPFKAVDTDTIRKNKFQTPKERPLKKQETVSTENSFEESIESDNDLPF